MPVSTDPRIGSDFLGYRIEALLGRGGMSVVYRARHTALDRNVALKLLAPELAEDARFRERFLRESKLAASLDHPSIVPVYDAGEFEGQLYIAMRYVEGSDLKQLLHERGALEPSRTLELLGQLADALDFAHERGLVHRDVKPSNALLDTHHAYLADFGLTKSASERSAITVTGRIMGTVDYAAPEQIEGKQIDGRADIYSLGCLVFECLTGDVPFPRDSELAVLWAHVHEPPPKMAAYPAIDPVLAKALAKEPGRRFATCRELIDEARKALGIQDVLVIRDRRPLLLVVAGGLLAAGALAASLVLAFTGGGNAPKTDLTVRGNTVVRIDAATGKVIGVTPVGKGPEAVAVGGGTVFVHNWTDGTVSKLDLRTGSVRDTVGLPGSAPPHPARTIAADARGAWVVQSAPEGGVLTHIRAGRLLPQEITFPGAPSTVAIGMNAVWVGVRTLEGSFLLEVDPADRSTRRTVLLPFDDPVQSIAFGDGAVWVANAGLRQPRLVRIDPSTGEITKQAPIATQGGVMAGIAFGSGAVWAAQVGPPALLRIDPRTLRTTRTIPAPPIAITAGTSGGGVANLLLADGDVWWGGTDTGDLWRVDPRTAKVASVHVAPPIGEQQPESVWDMFEPLGMAAGGGSVWVTVTLPF